MLNIVKSKNDNNYDKFTISTETGSFIITFENNLDLYWYCYDNRHDDKDITFRITKENYELYELFLNLFKSITNNDIFKDQVKYHSEDRVYEESSILFLELDSEDILITFRKSKSDIYFDSYCIRITLSGSNYSPYNYEFMKMYQNLKDLNYEHHQIHIEELLYEKKLRKEKYEI